MVKGRLMMALDFAVRKHVPHTVATFQRDGKWTVIKTGPKYHNVYEITEFDRDGEIWLLAHQTDHEIKNPIAPSVSGHGNDQSTGAAAGDR